MRVLNERPFYGSRDPSPRPAELALIRGCDPQGFWPWPPKESAIDA